MNRLLPHTTRDAALFLTLILVLCAGLPATAPAQFTDVTTPVLQNSGFSHGGVAWGDYDNDGDLDLYVSALGANKLFRNDSGVWIDATSSPLDDPGSGFGVVWGDYDNDGLLDLCLAKFAAANKLFHNNGAGMFTDATSGPLTIVSNSRGIAWGDYDNDGDLDLYVGNDGTNTLVRNDGAGAFTDATSGPLGDTGNNIAVA